MAPLKVHNDCLLKDKLKGANSTVILNLKTDEVTPMYNSATHLYVAYSCPFIGNRPYEYVPCSNWYTVLRGYVEADDVADLSSVADAEAGVRHDAAGVPHEAGGADEMPPENRCNVVKASLSRRWC